LLKEIGDYAFYGTNPKKIELPEKCEIISGLSLINVNRISICSGNPFLMTDKSFVKTRDNKILIRYFGDEEKIVIDKEVETISSGCFCNCNFVLEVLFESGSKLKYVGERAFEGTSIQTITITSNIRIIGNQSFFSC
jgi:hypothetical protein